MTTSAHSPLSLSVVLLAAGLSKRMGAANKLLLPIDGEPLVRRSARILGMLTEHVTVVVGHEADRIRAALDGLDVATVENGRFADGQQSSVALGLRSACATTDAVMIALADQPLLTIADLADLTAAYANGSRDKIMIPYHGLDRGNPILIPRAIANRLLRDSRNPACRRFIESNPGLVARFEATNDHFTTDLDTPHDAGRLGIALSSHPVASR